MPPFGGAIQSANWPHPERSRPMGGVVEGPGLLGATTEQVASTAPPCARLRSGDERVSRQPRPWPASLRLQPAAVRRPVPARAAARWRPKTAPRRPKTALDFCDRGLRLGRDLRRRFRFGQRIVEGALGFGHGLLALGHAFLDGALDLLGRIERLQVEPRRGLELLLHLVELGLADHLVDMAAELRRHAAHLGHPLAPAAQHVRQLLGADHDQRHDRDDQKLRTVDTEHRRSCLPRTDERH